MLKVGDRVYLDGTQEQGTVKEIHPHEAVVRVQVPGGHEDRRMGLESLRLDPTMKEATGFIDH
jgi:hypothetical protein